MIDRDDLMETWRNHVNDAIGAAEGLGERCDDFIKEASRVLDDVGTPYPFGAEMSHFSDYRNTVNEILHHLADSMKVYHEYVEIFGDGSLIRCDCCNQFKADTADYRGDNGKIWHLCPDCKTGTEVAA